MLFASTCDKETFPFPSKFYVFPRFYVNHLIRWGIVFLPPLYGPQIFHYIFASYRKVHCVIHVFPIHFILSFRHPLPDYWLPYSTIFFFNRRFWAYYFSREYAKFIFQPKFKFLPYPICSSF